MSKTCDNRRKTIQEDFEILKHTNGIGLFHDVENGNFSFYSKENAIIVAKEISCSIVIVRSRNVDIYFDNCTNIRVNLIDCENISLYGLPQDNRVCSVYTPMFKKEHNKNDVFVTINTEDGRCDSQESGTVIAYYRTTLTQDKVNKASKNLPDIIKQFDKDQTKYLNRVIRNQNNFVNVYSREENNHMDSFKNRVGIFIPESFDIKTRGCVYKIDFFQQKPKMLYYYHKHPTIKFQMRKELPYCNIGATKEENRQYRIEKQQIRREQEKRKEEYRLEAPLREECQRQIREEQEKQAKEFLDKKMEPERKRQREQKEKEEHYNKEMERLVKHMENLNKKYYVDPNRAMLLKQDEEREKAEEERSRKKYEELKAKYPRGRIPYDVRERMRKEAMDEVYGRLAIKSNNNSAEPQYPKRRSETHYKEPRMSARIPNPASTNITG